MNNWKKALALLLSLLMALCLFSGCGKDENTDSESGSDGEAATSTLEFDYSQGIGDDGYWENLKASDLVTLPEDYKNMVVSEADVTVTDSDVESEIQSILESYSEDVQITDRAPVEGDSINFDYDGRLADGTTVDGMSTTDTEMVLGEGRMIEGFEEAIIAAGQLPGTPFDINVTFPDPHENNTDLSGKDAIFTITVNWINESNVPELTDQFVSEALSSDYGVSTVAELRTAIKENLYESNLLYALESHLVDDSVYSEIPEYMITYQQDANCYYYHALAQQYASYYSSDEETMFYYLTYCQSDEELNETYAENYESCVKYFLACQAVAEKENIKVTDADFDAYFTDYMDGSDSADYVDFYGKGYITCVVLDQMVVDFLKDNCTIQ